MPAATRPSHHSACPPKNRPAMPSGEVNGVQDRIFAVRPDAPMMTGAKNPPTVMTPMIVRKVVRALDPTTVDAQTRSAKTDHAVSSSVRANQPSPGSMAKAREVLPDSDSPSSVTTAAATRWMTTSDRVPVIRPEAEARGGIVAAMISVIRLRFSRRRFWYSAVPSVATTSREKATMAHSSGVATDSSTAGVCSSVASVSGASFSSSCSGCLSSAMIVGCPWPLGSWMNAASTLPSRTSFSASVVSSASVISTPSCCSYIWAWSPTPTIAMDGVPESFCASVTMPVTIAARTPRMITAAVTRK